MRCARDRERAEPSTTAASRRTYALKEAAARLPDIGAARLSRFRVIGATSLLFRGKHSWARRRLEPRCAVTPGPSSGSAIRTRSAALFLSLKSRRFARTRDVRVLRPRRHLYCRKRIHHRIRPRRLHKREASLRRSPRGRRRRRPGAHSRARHDDRVGPSSRSPRRTWRSSAGRATATSHRPGEGCVTCYVKSAPRRRRGTESDKLERGPAPS